MKETTQQLILFFGILACLCIHQSCTHDPYIPGNMEPDPMDTTTNPIDTMVIDTTIVENPCDSNVIYFEKDILPILLGSCAFVGCHDASTASDEVILDTYDNIINTGEVEPFNLSESKLYKVITDNDPDDVMPPSGKMDNEKISLISQWILQGAQNLQCDDHSGDCITDNITYSGYVADVFNTSCNGCHSTSAAFGGIILDTYDGVKKVVDADRLYGSINWAQGYQKMPQGQDQLDSCTIAKVKTWIDEGAQNN